MGTVKDCEASTPLISAAPGMFIALVTARELVETFLDAGNPDESTRVRLEIIEKVMSNGLEHFERKDKEHG